MYKNNQKIEVTLAIDQYLLRSGIQFIIKQLGYDVHYHYLHNIDTLEKGSHADFLILHHKLIDKPKAVNLKKILNYYKGHVLLIANETMHVDFFNNVICPSDSEVKIIEKIETFFSAIKHQTTDNNEVISTREIDILKHVALGYSNKEIADKLFISINTVITHRKNLTEKLGIKTISGLTVYALMNNLINAGDVKP